MSLLLHGAKQDQSLCWAQAVLDSLAFAFGTAWMHVNRTDRKPDPHVRSARVGIKLLIRWVIETRSSGDLKRVIGLFAWWRRVAVGDLLEGTKQPFDTPSIGSVFRGALSLSGYAPDGRARILSQMARARRGGPFPEAAAVARARQAHRDNLMAKFRTRRSDLKSIKHFGAVWANGKPWRDFLGAVSFPVSEGATAASKKGEGMTKELREGIESLRNRPFTKALVADILYVCQGVLPEEPFRPGFVKNKLHGLVGTKTLVGDHLFPGLAMTWGQEEEDRRRVLYGYVAMALRTLRLIRSSKDLPRGRQSTVLERGEKTRIVTPVTGCVGYMGNILNKILLAALETDKRTCKAKGRTHAHDCVNWASVPPLRKHVCRNVDMTSATDLMPHDLVRALVEGLVSEWGLPPFLADCLFLCTGPFELELCGVFEKTCRGILMGIGTSWPLLSLYNLWLWEGAWTEAGLRRAGLAGRRERQKVRLVGDDLLGIAPRKVSDTYTIRLIRTGGKPSYGKDTLSQEYGLLAEETILLGGNMTLSGKRTEARVLSTGSVKLLQPSGSTPMWAMGPELCEGLSHLGKFIGPWIKGRFRDEIATLRNNQIPPFVPRELGGGGFPCGDVGAAVRALQPKWARALRVVLAQPLEKQGSLLGRISTAWAQMGGVAPPAWVRNFRESSFEAALQSFPGLTEREAKEPGSCLTLTEAVELCVRNPADGLYGNGCKYEKTLRLSTVSKQLKKAIAEINTVIPWSRLRDRPTELWIGWGRLREQAHRPVSKHALPNIASLFSINQ